MQAGLEYNPGQHMAGIKSECDYYNDGECGAPSVSSYLLAKKTILYITAELDREDLSVEQRRYLEDQLTANNKILNIWEGRLPDGAVVGETGVNCSLCQGRGECSGRP